MNLNFLRLGVRTLWRDLRVGGLNVLLVAVTLAVAALTSVGFFADRLQGGLQRDALQLLGGDVVVVSDNPTPAIFVQQAKALGLETATTLAFPTMARASPAQGGAVKLVALKSVPLGYPLRGSLTVANAPHSPGEATRNIPAVGEVWVDAPLLESLHLQLGDVLLLGNAQFRITRTIVIEPDRGSGLMSFAPRAMLNGADLQATGLVQPASRVTYRFAVAGPDQGVVKQFADRVGIELKKTDADAVRSLRGVRLESLETGRPEMQQTLDRAQKFLNLVALLSALLSAVAVALAARGFAARHLDGAALLRVLGQSQRTIAWSYTVEFALVGLCASVLGVALGFGIHYAFVLLLAGLVDSALPAPSLWPVALGMGVGFTLLLAFGLPPVLQLAQVPPLRVIRRDVGALRPASLGVLAVGVAGFAVLLLVVSRDVPLGLIAVGGFASAVLVFAVLGGLAVKLLRHSVNEATAPQWLILATRQISARPAYAIVQISSLAVGLLALVLLVLLRTDLIGSWSKTTPPDAPNRFVINIQPDQADAFQQALQKAGIRQYDWFPMIRGRLLAVNDRPVGPDDYTQERAKRLVDREFNLSTALELPAHNTVVAGEWVPHEQGAISIEEGVAETLNLKLGDHLQFDMGGTVVNARITNLRRVDWGSLRANFFAIYPVERLEGVAVSYLAAYRAPEITGFDNALVREFPNITNVDMSATVAQVQRVLGQVIRAVEFLFAFTLAAGLIVLFAAVTATREERAHEFAIMRALGARASLLRQVQRAELLGVGGLAGFLASSVAVVVGWALAHYVFHFAWTAPLWVPLAGSAAGAVLALLAGWWGLREVLQRPVVETLRRSTE